MKDNKYLIPVLLIATVIVTIIGGTLAYWNWQTTNAQKTNVTFTIGANFSCGADGGGNITGTSLAPTDCTNSTYAIQRTVTTSITNNSGEPVYMDMWLNINSIGTGLSQSSNFKYALTTSNSSCTTGVVSQGTFQGKVANDKIKLLSGVTSGSTYSMSNHCFTSNPTSCIHLIKDGATVSSGYSVSVSYYESDGSKYSTLSEDNIDEAGTRFSTIVYDVKYNGASRAKVTVSNVTITR